MAAVLCGGESMSGLTTKTVKIKLLVDIPVAGKHGLTKGRVLETVPAPRAKRGLSGVWVQGNGESVRVLPCEYEVSQ